LVPVKYVVTVSSIAITFWISSRKSSTGVAGLWLIVEANAPTRARSALTDANWSVRNPWCAARTSATEA